MARSMDLASLQAAVRAGERFTYRYFWGHRPPHGVLSQWYPSRFTVDGVTYVSAEQWMMAEKARLFGDAVALRAILDETDPDRVKGHGRRVRHFEEAKWEAARFAVVVAGSTHKFSQNDALRAYLLSTGADVLVEASPLDAIWGIGLHRDDPDARNPLTWRGLNLLGFALMHARETIVAA